MKVFIRESEKLHATVAFDQSTFQYFMYLFTNIPIAAIHRFKKSTAKKIYLSG